MAWQAGRKVQIWGEHWIIGFECITLQGIPRKAKLPPQVPSESIRLEMGSVVVNEQIVAGYDPFFRPRSRGKGLMIVQTVPDDGKQRGGNAPRLRRVGVRQILDQPWHEPGQIPPAQEQRLIGVEQHTWSLLDQSRNSDWHHRAGGEHTAVSVTRPLACASLVDQDNIMAVPLKPQGGGNAHDSGSDNDSGLARYGHVKVSPSIGPHSSGSYPDPGEYPIRDRPVQPRHRLPAERVLPKRLL